MEPEKSSTTRRAAKEKLLEIANKRLSSVSISDNGYKLRVNKRVFKWSNNESDKFQRWLRKPNISLGNTSPYSLFDSLTGIKRVLNRIEFGNMT